ncbi:hypothetical protein M413DRAFT_438727 [Hebeloma cylindrosporum]|uniref:Uncharacterized protein n=1 Tax=Hebeloma cylindrosporum TaxID=76867 RepID=A0A0C2Z8U4_HEBCY|nr:hypothetical protein M413DRAFT_438727 [Hebeloma cylindrosporum h7]
MSLLAPLVEIFRYSLRPIAPFTWLGWGISTLDVVATIRLCIALRQIRELTLKAHITTKGHSPVEESSFVKSVSTTWLVVYGGEAVAAPLLGFPPSFMISGVVPGLYAAIQAIVDFLPAVPAPSAELELPLSIIDGFTRAYLLCNLIPPAVTANASPLISSSPWTLLVTSLVIANGGFFFTNLFSFLSPTSLSIQTPPELQPYGWTTADLWCAPTITGLYALLTHAQPFWGELHELLAQVLGATSVGEPVKALDPEHARAVCALLLSGLFLGRTVKNFGLWKPFPQKIVRKTKTQ